MNKVPAIPALPRQAGGFELLKELGSGGMGVVYEARELSSGRRVALKVLSAELSEHEEAFERFRREARIAAAISDMRCVFVYGAHHVEGSPAIAMELCGGETLQDRIKSEAPIAIHDAVRWMIDVIDGLEAAHRAGVLHRDVKPSNCFLTPDGRVKVGDFGLSRTLEKDVQLTQSGQFLGSPLYASPEQIRGRNVDVKSDQYSCAGTLYALLTGKPPFPGNNVGEVLARILSEEPIAPRALRPEIPRALERIVLRALQRDPGKRYRDLEAFRAALAPYQSTEASTASPWRRFGAWIVDAALATTLSNVAGAAVTPSDFDVDPDRPWIVMPLSVYFVSGAVPLVYYAVLETLFGAALGKWLFGLRVLTVGALGNARIVARAAWYVVPTILLGVSTQLVAPNQGWSVGLSFGGLALIVAARFSTMRPHNGWRGLHEILSGTRTIQIPSPFRRPRATVSPPETEVERHGRSDTSLGTYQVTGRLGGTARGELLHARDAGLERSVWIHVRTRGDGVDEARRQLARPARLRWLDRLSIDGEQLTADVFESPGGCGLPALAHSGVRVAWPTAERALLALADELTICEREDPDARHALEALWLDRDWTLRVLDEPIGARDDVRMLTGLELLNAAARALLIGNSTERRLPRDLPLHAESLVLRLTGFEAPFANLAQARAALTRAAQDAVVVERRTRFAQLAINCMLPGLIAILLAFMVLAAARILPITFEMQTLQHELLRGTASWQGQGEREPFVIDERGRADREVLLAEQMNRPYASFAQGGAIAPAALARATELQESLDPQQVAEARERVNRERGVEGESNLDQIVRFLQHGWLLAPALVAALWTIAAVGFALVFSVGLSFRIFGLSVRTRAGRRLPRWLGMLRALAIGVPLCAAYTGAFFLAYGGHVVGGYALAIGAVLVHAAALTYALVYVDRTAIDRVLGMRIVPR